MKFSIVLEVDGAKEGIFGDDGQSLADILSACGTEISRECVSLDDGSTSLVVATYEVTSRKFERIRDAIKPNSRNAGRKRVHVKPGFAFKRTSWPNFKAYYDTHAQDQVIDHYELCVVRYNKWGGFDRNERLSRATMVQRVAKADEYYAECKRQATESGTVYRDRNDLEWYLNI